MDLAQVLRELGSRRGWLVVGVLVALFAGLMTAYSPSLSPPGLHKRSLELGAAQTEVLIDGPRSRVIDIAGDLSPIVERATIFSRIMSSPPATRVVAQQAKLPVDLLVAGSGQADSPGSEERSSQILTESSSYRVFFQSKTDEPLVDISTQAPSAKEAIRLADAAAVGFRSYVTNLQNRQSLSKSRRVQVIQLGSARGGVINPGVNVLIAVLTVVGVFIVACLLILFGSSLGRNLRASRVASTVSYPTGPADDAGNGGQRRVSDPPADYAEYASRYR